MQFVLDIFVNNRLYAANFKTLNDPMEGWYVYSKGSLTQEQIIHIRGSKAASNVLSLSASSNNLLMWSYYGEGHTGIVVGVKVVDEGAIIEPIKYVSNLKLREFAMSDLSHDEIALQVLCKKLKSWSHEKEYRVFKRLENYVRVEVTDLFFGLKADEDKIQLVSAVAKSLCPNINIQKMRRKDLDSQTELI